VQLEPKKLQLTTVTNSSSFRSKTAVPIHRDPDSSGFQP
jgi:hypothetical protein